MKKMVIFCLAAMIGYPGLSQQRETIVVNPVKQDEQEVFKKMYQYPAFMAGMAFYKNGDIVRSKLNYNFLTNQIMFIAPKGDTLELVNGGNFSRIVIDADSFYFYNNQFIQQLTHFADYNLMVRRSLQNKGSEKKGAYDTYSSNSSISSVSTVVDNRFGNVTLLSDQNITFAFEDSYFFSGKFGQFYPATKKGAHDLFGKNEKQLKEFLEKNAINFNKKEDIEKVLEYARTVLK